MRIGLLIDFGCLVIFCLSVLAIFMVKYAAPVYGTRMNEKMGYWDVTYELICISRCLLVFCILLFIVLGPLMRIWGILNDICDLSLKV